VESEPGKGSTFHFTLPAIAVHSGGGRADGAEHRKAKAHGQDSSRR
jgi:hypothetical protein